MQLNFTTQTCTSQLMAQHDCHTLCLVMILHWCLDLTWYVPHVLHFVMVDPSFITPITIPHFTHYGRTLKSFFGSSSCYFTPPPPPSFIPIHAPPPLHHPLDVGSISPHPLVSLSYLPCSNSSWKSLFSCSWKIFSQAQGEIWFPSSLCNRRLV
jgi:hypothetical protein